MLGVDDELLKESPRSIPRADVAELCVQALLQPEARNRCAPAAHCLVWFAACEELVAAGRLQAIVHACCGKELAASGRQGIFGAGPARLSRVILVLACM